MAQQSHQYGGFLKEGPVCNMKDNFVTDRFPSTLLIEASIYVRCCISLFLVPFKGVTLILMAYLQNKPSLQDQRESSTPTDQLIVTSSLFTRQGCTFCSRAAVPGTATTNSTELGFINNEEAAGLAGTPSICWLGCLTITDFILMAYPKQVINIETWETPLGIQNGL